MTKMPTCSTYDLGPLVSTQTDRQLWRLVRPTSLAHLASSQMNQ